MKIPQLTQKNTSKSIFCFVWSVLFKQANWSEHIGQLYKVDNKKILKYKEFLECMEYLLSVHLSVYVRPFAQSVFRMRQTPCNTQWLMCSVVARSASNTRPTPIAFLLWDVTYTGVRNVFWNYINLHMLLALC